MFQQSVKKSAFGAGLSSPLLYSSETSTAPMSALFYSSYKSPGTPPRLDWGDLAKTPAVAPSGCCGSSLQYPHARQAPPFTRQVTGPTIDSPFARAHRKDATHPSR